MKNTSEFLGWEISLAKGVVILEELEHSNAVLLDKFLNLLHEGSVVADTFEISESVSESGLGTGSVSVDNILEAVGVSEEISVPDRVVLLTVNERDGIGLSLIDLETEGVKHLSEDLGRHLEVTERISVLEEALGIQSVGSDELTELVNNFTADFSLTIAGLTSSVDGGSAAGTDLGVKVLLETLLGEDLVDSVGELSPLDMSSFLGSLESFAEHVELLLGDRGLGHGEANSELSSSDVA